MKSIKTSIEWWQNFPRQFASRETLLSLSNPLAEIYPRLSKDHLYHLAVEVTRFIYREFSSSRRHGEKAQLEWIEILQDIIEKGNVLERSQCESENIEYLSRFNAQDADMLNWMLANAIGPSANKLAKPRHTANYAIVTKQLTKAVTLWAFISYYNFLVAQPELSETQQKIVDKLFFNIERWSDNPVFPIASTKSDKSTERKVGFTLPLSEQPPDSPSSTVNKENLVPLPAHQPEKPKT